LHNYLKDISIIIVNYNVQALLEQTLISVKKSIAKLNVEVIVVDNHSVDGSCNMVKKKFSDVLLIENKDNVGFSKANNQGINLSIGKYVLLLNPDTVLAEDTLTKTFNYMESDEKVGALGVRMIDGSGVFLPESKRGLPTPAVAFYKMSGLARLFKKSKIFGKYHLSYLSEFETHEVDVLSGAFMMLRKSVLDEVGLLDENFFMYGEDIDLSYRIQKGGYRNIYFSDTTIIHYKGESTKKHSLNYVKIFYLAMAKFATKHFSKHQGWWFSVCINFAIFVRAFLSLFARSIKFLKLFVLDFILIYAGYWAITRYWELYNKFVVGGFYPDSYYYIHVPIYIFIWILGVFLSGGYSQVFKLSKTRRGVLFGSLILLTLYALLPENMRFSRALILLGSAWAFFATIINRLILHFLKYKSFDTNISQIANVLIVGEIDECLRVKQILLNHQQKFKILGFIKPSSSIADGEWLGNSEDLPLLIDVFKANEIIFCSKNIDGSEIMSLMSHEMNEKVRFKIIPESGDFIIGSHSKNANGEFYGVDLSHVLNDKATRFQKRILDIFLCFIFVLFAPFLLFKNTFFKIVFSNFFDCLKGRKTWVGYNNQSKNQHLPALNPCVFDNAILLNQELRNNQMLKNLNIMYASHYNIYNDINIVVKLIFFNKFACQKPN